MCDYCGCVQAWEDREAERSIQGGADRACVAMKKAERYRELNKLVQKWDSDPYNDLVADLHKLVKKWPESIPTDELEKLLEWGE